MGLLDLKTDLKSLKFGMAPATDTPGGGNSGQPYITNPIDRNIVPQSEDFLLRGGLNAPLDAATDEVRLTKFFGDLKSPRGILFVAKQNLLSRIGVATQASGNQVKNNSWENAPLNEGLYTPLSTIAQAGVNFAGAHLYKQGLNPLKGVTTYSDVVRGSGILDNSIVKIDSNRLVGLYNNTQDIFSSNVNILSYSGGPGSSLGIGKTNIKFATSNTGTPLQTGIKNFNFPQSFFAPPSLPFNPFLTPLGLPSFLKKETLSRGFDVFKGKETKIQDFREELFQISRQSTSRVTGIAPSYKPEDGKTIDGVNGSRIGYTSPGQSNKNLISYTDGSGIGPIDKINAQPIYQSKEVKESGVSKNDLVKFRIAAINETNPQEKEFIHFRAYIDSFSDAYNANWNEEKYLGRGESFWKYGGFARNISLSFTVAAQSKEELIAQYKKLNFLASNLAPTYSPSGYMGGSLVQLTLGGWCYELPGFISSMTLDIPQESPWEIGIDDKGGYDSTVKEMPHIVKVSGFSFTPIHTFRPEKQTNEYNLKNGGISKYGNQRYIALSGGSPLKSNYDDKIN